MSIGPIHPWTFWAYIPCKLAQNCICILPRLGIVTLRNLLPHNLQLETSVSANICSLAPDWLGSEGAG